MSSWASFKRKQEGIGHFLVLLVFVVAMVVGGALYVDRHHKAAAKPKTAAAPADPVSYQLMQLAQGIVKLVRPAPTAAALNYAYLASVYDDSLGSGQAQAVLASSEMLKTIFPDYQQQIATGIAQIASKNSLALPAQLNSKDQAVLEGYDNRYKTDGHDLAWDGIVPTGPCKWYKVSGDPLTPRAGDWKRWVAYRTISIPPPPACGSAEDLAQLAKTAAASAGRTGEDINEINYWGGAPGTETPSGIWQNQLYKTIKTELPSDTLKADQDYARLQKVLAQTLSDAFMECWKVKYTYWTARPDMRDSDIHTAMKDPLFPSYISGHSTISKAAAGVLSVMVPAHSKDWEADADAARHSRLVAGIHFDIDNQEGFVVGQAVAQQYITSLHLQKVL